MSTVKNSEYQNDITFILDYFVDQDEYNPWKDRLTDQLLKNVDVQGFRKGKVPREVAIKKVDPSVLNETIIKETLEKYAQDAVGEVTKKLEDDKRIIQNIEINIEPEFTGEKDNGFAFRLVAKLLPDIDIKSLETIKVKEPTADDINNRPTEKEFIASEKLRFFKTYNEYNTTDKGAKKGDKVICDLNGTIDGVADSKLASPNVEIILGSGDFLPEFEKNLPGIKKGETKEIKVSFPSTYFETSVAGKKATFAVTCKDVLEPKHADLEEIFKHSAAVKEQFNSFAEFNEFLVRFYNDETDRLLEELRQRIIIQTVVSAVPDFSLPEDRIESETKRIFAAVKQDSETKNISLFEAFSRSGIPADGAKTNADEIEVRALIELYVRNEFKLSTILHYIYEKLAENKIMTPQLDKATEEVKKNPGQFGLAADSDDETVRRHTLDRLQRQEGARYLFNKFAPASAAKEHAHDHSGHDHNHEHLTKEITDVEVKAKPRKSTKKGK